MTDAIAPLDSLKQLRMSDVGVCLRLKWIIQNDQQMTKNLATGEAALFSESGRF
jgi:hypothetical protein